MEHGSHKPHTAANDFQQYIYKACHTLHFIGAKVDIFGVGKKKRKTMLFILKKNETYWKLSLMMMLYHEGGYNLATLKLMEHGLLAI